MNKKQAIKKLDKAESTGEILKALEDIVTSNSKMK